MLFAHALVTQKKSENIQRFLLELATKGQGTHRKRSMSKYEGTNYSPDLQSNLLSSELHCLDFEVNPCEWRKMWNTCGHGQVQAQEFPVLVFRGLPFLSLDLMSSAGREQSVFSSRMSSLRRTRNVLYNHAKPLSRSGVRVLTPLIRGKQCREDLSHEVGRLRNWVGATAAAWVCCYFGVVVFVMGLCTQIKIPQLCCITSCFYLQLFFVVEHCCCSQQGQ